MPRRLTQQQMTLNVSSASRAISVVAELPVLCAFVQYRPRFLQVTLHIRTSYFDFL